METEVGAVVLLFDEARSLYREGRFADSLRIAELAQQGADYLDHLGLQVSAAHLRAAALSALGRHEAALVPLLWIIGVARDPEKRAALEGAGVDFEVASAYVQWASTARFLPGYHARDLLPLLDAGEAYVRSVGRPMWRSGALHARGADPGGPRPR